MHRLPLWRHQFSIALALAAVLAAPFVLRPTNSTAPSRFDRRLVILTPHYERIREEFGSAFAHHWKEKTGETLFIDWRVPGGTSEIATMLKSEYTAAFQYHWEQDLGNKWTTEVAATCLNGRTPASDPAREAFLNSNLGIGVDVFFGGGSFDFIQQAEAGVLVAANGAGTGLPAIRQGHPNWFADAVLPEAVSGEIYRDAKDRWCGACLSSFGIVFNRDVLRRLGISGDLTQWSDLADPRLRGQVALADPGRSASVTKAFEMLIQQEMQTAVSNLQKQPGKRTPEEVSEEGVRRGWIKGLNLIQRISANARYYSDTSTKICLDVARGDAAAGMCIDFYGRTVQEDVWEPSGASRIGFVMPVGGTSVSVDPIGMLRGAPEPAVATAFMEFVLGPEGQRLWSYRPGSAGGPAEHALRRLPVRRDFYTADHLRFMTDAAEMPYDKAAAFTYHAEWTGAAFSALRFILRVTCVDTHAEQREAWQSLVGAGLPGRASEVFHDLNSVRYDVAVDLINKTVRSRDKVAETRLARNIGNTIRRNYRLAESLAQRNQFSIAPP